MAINLTGSLLSDESVLSGSLNEPTVLSGKLTTLPQTGGGGGSVDSVNGQTGVVFLTAEDVGALPDDTVIPSKTSELENDSGFLTDHQSLEGYATETYVKDKIAEAQIGGGDIDLSDYAKKTELPTKTSQLTNDSGFLTQHQDLSSYAKKSEIPTVPTNVSAFNNDAGYLTKHQSLDGYATEQYVNTAISQIPTPDVSGQISTHNVATDSHNDIRLLISGLTQRINALADSDDSTLDQMSEVVAYIKDNRELIDQVTTAKISVTDIIDNLTTNVSNKPLSAAQGVVLKQLVDGLTTAMGGKLDASALTEAINTALAQAKASGEFDGADGAQGKQGEAGYTPQKGVDYWTETDIQEIVADVISALPVYSGESEAFE